ncbi:MAG: hypothetical protein WBQ85_11235 [Candidatus Sulfotelmatobacter sp.]
MSDQTKHENAAGHGGFERQDLQPRGILYFLLGLVMFLLLSALGIRGVYAFLDHREKALQPPMNPLVTNVPTDTRHIPAGYPQSVFPNPKLEENERGQLNGILLQEENTLYSYGWIDEKTGTVRIPIERAMDLIAQRGLPVRPRGAALVATITPGIADRTSRERWIKPAGSESARRVTKK